MKPRFWSRLVQSLIVLSLPVLLIGVNVRAITGHWFVRWEYRKEGFPPDTYGFSVAERSHLAEVCVDYLATGADIAMLEELRLPDGQPAFNQRELRHMVDVQVVYGYLMTACLLAGSVVVVGVVLLARLATRGQAAGALLGGSLFTLTLLLAVGAYMMVNWSDFFTAFHRVFFEGDTWLFQYSDTLIRLFPMRFWADVAVAIVVPLFVEVFLVGGTGWVWMRRLTSSPES